MAINKKNIDIYKFDKLCNVTQNIIYNCIYTYFLNFPNIPIQKTSNEDIISFLIKNNINYSKLKKLVSPIRLEDIDTIEYSNYA